MSRPKRPPSIPNQSDILPYLATVLAAVLPFLKALGAEFVFDDGPAVVTNSDVLGTSSLRDLFFHDFWGNDVHLPGSHKSWRPLTTLSFRWTHSIFGLSPVAFHACNIILHALICCLMYCFTGRLGMNLRTRLVAVLWFCVHPVHCEAVSGVVGRADLLSCLFVLLGLIYHDIYQEPLGVILLSSLALLSKETGLTLLPLAVAHSLILRRSPNKNLLTLLAAFLFIASARVSFTGSPSFSSSDNPLPHEKSLFTRVATTFYLPVFHLQLLIFPKDLCFDWSMGSIPLITSSVDVRLWYSLGVYMAACWFTTKLFLSKSRLGLYCIVFSVISFLPASNIFFPVGFLAAERILYLPSLDFCILAAIVIEELCQKCKLPFAQVAVVIFCLLTTRTLRRNEDWVTAEALYSSAVHLNPPKAWANLGQTLASKGQLEAAASAYDHALQHRGNMADTWYNLGVLQSGLGNHTEAEKSYSTAIRIRSSFAAAHLNLGVSLWRQGRKEEAERVLTRCLEIDGRGLKNWRVHEEAQNGCRVHRGRIRMKERRWEEAKEDFLESLSSTDGSLKLLASKSLAEVDVHLGHLDEASVRLQELLHENGAHIPSLLLFSQILVKQNNTQKAETILRKAVHSSGNCLQCLSKLGLLIAERSPKESEGLLRRAVLIEPKGVHLLNYGVILHKNGRLEEAEGIYRRVMEEGGGEGKLARENLEKLKRSKAKRVKQL